MYIVIPVIDQNYDVNDAMTASIHVVVQVIDRNYETNTIMAAVLQNN